VHPATLLEVKQIIIDSNVSELQTLANKALKASNGIEVANIMRKTTA
jgi:phosphoenolpyruvate-protein kinase (PTS system EI component)